MSGAAEDASPRPAGVPGADVPVDAVGDDAHGADQLAAAVATLGVRGRIEARGRLAVLHADAGDAPVLADTALRQRLTAAALRCGFTHLALELPAAAASSTPHHLQAGDAGDSRAHLRRA